MSNSSDFIENEINGMPAHKRGLVKIKSIESEYSKHRYRRSSYGDPVGLGVLPHHVFITRIYDNRTKQYRAFCSGSIIGPEKVLSSAHCFMTPKKNLHQNQSLNDIHVVGGSVTVYTYKNILGQQWRQISKIHTQKFFRFPAYSLAVLIVDKPWEFNANVNFIPLASKNPDFNGICWSAQARTTTAWAHSRVLFKEAMHILKQSECEYTLQKNCRIYYCTAAKKENHLRSAGTQGAGLVCYDTADPEEIDDRGVLCGVTTQINVNLPTLHNRVGMFKKWIEDSASCIYKKRDCFGLLIFVWCILVWL